MGIYLPKIFIFERILNFFSKKFGSLKNIRTFAIPNGKNAEIAQLVEHNLAKVGVASSSLVFRSKKVSRDADLNFAKPDEVQLYMQSFSYRDGFFYFTDPISASIFFGMSVFFMTQPNASAPAPYANTGTTVPV